MTDSKNSDRYLVLLEDISAKVELIAEGHGQLVQGQIQLNAKLDSMAQRFDRLEIKVDYNNHKIRELTAAI